MVCVSLPLDPFTPNVNVNALTEINGHKQSGSKMGLQPILEQLHSFQ